MLSYRHRLSAVLLTLAVAAGPAGVCAGWMATPEARLACCSDDGRCPMHRSESEDGPTRVVTQGEADRCCAASEHEDSTPSPSSAAFFVTLTVALNPLPALLPAPEPHPDMWRAAVPTPPAHVAKHLLLSVFLL